MTVYGFDLQTCQRIKNVVVAIERDRRVVTPRNRRWHQGQSRGTNAKSTGAVIGGEGFLLEDLSASANCGAVAQTARVGTASINNLGVWGLDGGEAIVTNRDDQLTLRVGTYVVFGVVNGENRVLEYNFSYCSDITQMALRPDAAAAPIIWQSNFPATPGTQGAPFFIQNRYPSTKLFIARYRDDVGEVDATTILCKRYDINTGLEEQAYVYPVQTQPHRFVHGLAASPSDDRCCVCFAVSSSVIPAVFVSEPDGTIAWNDDAAGIQPRACAFDEDSNLYVGHTNAILKYDPDGPPREWNATLPAGYLYPRNFVYHTDGNLYFTMVLAANATLHRCSISTSGVFGPISPPLLSGVDRDWLALGINNYYLGRGRSGVEARRWSDDGLAWEYPGAQFEGVWGGDTNLVGDTLYVFDRGQGDTGIQFHSLVRLDEGGNIIWREPDVMDFAYVVTAKSGLVCTCGFPQPKVAP